MGVLNMLLVDWSGCWAAV